MADTDDGSEYTTMEDLVHRTNRLDLISPSTYLPEPEFDLLECVEALIRLKLGKARDRQSGVIYAALAHRTARGRNTDNTTANKAYLKVGYSQKRDGHRVGEIENKCHHIVIKAVETPLFQCAHRGEQIMLRWLGSSRRPPFSCQCTTDHHEWFDKDLDPVRSMMLIVYSWMVKVPYAENGELKPEWQDALTIWEKSLCKKQPMALEQFFLYNPPSIRGNNLLDHSLHSPWHFQPRSTPFRSRARPELFPIHTDPGLRKKDQDVPQSPSSPSVGKRRKSHAHLHYSSTSDIPRINIGGDSDGFDPLHSEVRSRVPSRQAGETYIEQDSAAHQGQTPEAVVTQSLVSPAPPSTLWKSVDDNDDHHHDTGHPLKSPRVIRNDYPDHRFPKYESIKSFVPTVKELNYIYRDLGAFELAFARAVRARGLPKDINREEALERLLPKHNKAPSKPTNKLNPIAGSTASNGIATWAELLTAGLSQSESALPGLRSCGTVTNVEETSQDMQSKNEDVTRDSSNRDSRELTDFRNDSDRLLEETRQKFDARDVEYSYSSDTSDEADDDLESTVSSGELEWLLRDALKHGFFDKKDLIAKGPTENQVSKEEAAQVVVAKGRGQDWQHEEALDNDSWYTTDEEDISDGDTSEHEDISEGPDQLTVEEGGEGEDVGKGEGASTTEDLSKGGGISKGEEETKNVASNNTQHKTQQPNPVIPSTTKRRPRIRVHFPDVDYNTELAKLKATTTLTTDIRSVLPSMVKFGEYGSTSNYRFHF